MEPAIVVEVWCNLTVLRYRLYKISRLLLSTNKFLSDILFSYWKRLEGLTLDISNCLGVIELTPDVFDLIIDIEEINIIEVMNELEIDEDFLDFVPFDDDFLFNELWSIKDSLLLFEDDL